MRAEDRLHQRLAVGMCEHLLEPVITQDHVDAGAAQVRLARTEGQVADLADQAVDALLDQQLPDRPPLVAVSGHPAGSLQNRDHRLADANRWLELARSGAYAGGPALGGALVGWIGVSTAYGLAAALSILAMLLLAGLPKDEPPPGQRRDLLHDLGEGARFAVGHDLLRPILLTAVFFNLSWFVFQAVYVAYAVQNLGLSATEVGITLGIYGAGMIVGAALAPAIARQVSFGMLILLGPFCGLCAASVMLATLWMPSVQLVGTSFFLFGVGPIIWTISTMTLRQAVTPNAMLGRVSALIMTATFGARPLGAAIGASVAAHFGIAACLALATAGFLVQLLVIAFSRVPRLQDLSEVA